MFHKSSIKRKFVNKLRENWRVKTLVIFLKLSNSACVLGISAKGSRNLNGKSRFTRGIQEEISAAAVMHKLTIFPGLAPLKTPKPLGPVASRTSFLRVPPVKLYFLLKPAFYFILVLVVFWFFFVVVVKNIFR